MTHPVSVPSSAFNIERARAAMMANVTIPEDFLDRAIHKIYQKLEAKKTLFFTHHGEVIEKVDVEDTNAQLTAADKIFDIAGVKARERDAPPAIPQVALEMDARTGIVRLVIGQAALVSTQPSAANDDASILPETPVGELVSATGKAEAMEVEEPPQQEYEPVVIKVRGKGNMPEAVRAALFGEPGNGSS